MKTPRWIKHIDHTWSLFLDRDGTINKRITGYVDDWAAFSFLPKAPESIAGLNHFFRYVFIVTNQQGIGKELMTHEDLHEIHTKMLEVLEYYDGHIDEIYYEPSLAVFDSFYRKPNPGMAHKAKAEFPAVDFKKSVMIGDTYSDILFGHQLGMRTVWIENEWEIGDKSMILDICDLHVMSLFDFLQYVENP